MRPMGETSICGHPICPGCRPPAPMIHGTVRINASSSILADRRAWHASSPDFSASRRYRCAASPPDHRDVFARCQPGAAIVGNLALTNPSLSQGSRQVLTGRGRSTRLRPRGTDQPPSSRAGACQYRGHHRRTLSGRGRLHIHHGYEPIRRHSFSKVVGRSTVARLMIAKRPIGFSAIVVHKLSYRAHRSARMEHNLAELGCTCHRSLRQSQTHLTSPPKIRACPIGD